MEGICLKKRIVCILLIAALAVSLFAVTASAAESPSENEQEIYAFLTGNLGLNRAAACGILANSYYETGYRADLTVGTFYGLFMYYAPLASALRSFCNENGYDYTKVSGQMEFLKAMFEGKIKNFNYTELFADLKDVPNTASGAYNAASMFCLDFERPANAEYEANKRGTYASGTLFPKFRDVTPGGGTTENSTTPSIGSEEEKPGFEEKAVSYTRIVKASTGLNVRSGPGAGYSRISGLANGTKVSVAAEAKSADGALWCRLKTGGWVCGMYLITEEEASEKGEEGENPGETSAEPQAVEETVYSVNASGLNVRRNAGTKYAIERCVYRGQLVTVVAEAKDEAGDTWCELKDGGWVCKEFLIPVEKHESGKTYTVHASALNVRSGVGTNTSVIGLRWDGETVVIVGTATDASGNLWGHLSGGGWVSMEFVA